VERLQVVQATDAVQQFATRHGLDWNSAFDPTTTFDNPRDSQHGATARAAECSRHRRALQTLRPGVSPEASLSWTALGAMNYDIAFGTGHPALRLRPSDSSASYTTTLAPNTTYFWQVIARNVAGTRQGRLGRSPQPTAVDLHRDATRSLVQDFSRRTYPMSAVTVERLGDARSLP
jgi:hypothetical protein